MMGIRSCGLLFGLLLAAVVAPPAALAGDIQIKLALKPVDQAGSFFDLTMRPGDARSLQVDVANDGQAAVAVRTYATDVYTIVNGGFGGRLRGVPRTGMTAWLDYVDEVVTLPAARSIRRGFTVTVPADAKPGEYIAGLILENDQPILDPGAVGLNQVIRQAVAVVVTVPGPRVPALAIGAATHKAVAGRSVVSIAVANTGNVRLKPAIGFTLYDAGGNPISHATTQMDTFYAHTDTFVELPLTSLLGPGRYSVRLTLVDEASSARAAAAAIPFVIDAPREAVGGGITPGLIEVIGAPGASAFWLAILGLIVALAAALAGFAWLTARRRRRRLDSAAPVAGR